MNKNVPVLIFIVKTGQKRSINSPAPLSNPHLAMPNAMPPSGQQAATTGSGGGAAASGSGPFASALRSLAIKADTKEDESVNESGGADGTSREGGVTSGPAAYGSSLVGERSRDSSQPANLSKHSGGISNNSRISVPQPQDLHTRTLHHGQTNSSERNRAEVSLNEERIAHKKKLTVSPPPEKVIFANIHSTELLF